MQDKLQKKIKGIMPHDNDCAVSFGKGKCDCGKDRVVKQILGVISQEVKDQNTKLLQIVVEDVPHQYQDRLLKALI